MNTVNSDSTVISLVNSVSSDVGLVNSTNHMEMKGIASKFESLTDISQFNVFNASNAGLITRGIEHDVSTILVSLRSFRISSVN